jgi:5-formyltetrahydrofolate cyclo-ligase
VSDFSPTGVAHEKAVMRAAVLRVRRDLPEERRRRFDAAIAAALSPLVRGREVAGYVPAVGEPGGEDLLRVLATASRLILPALQDDLDLDWAVYDGDLVRARYGLREPGPGSPRLGVMAVANVSLVVAPAVAVDRLGRRLGRGGGSYDRALARVPGAVPVLAVVYPDEVVERVPAEPHDRVVTGVVTPGGVSARLDAKRGNGAP